MKNLKDDKNTKYDWSMFFIRIMMWVLVVMPLVLTFSTFDWQYRTVGRVASKNVMIGRYLDNNNQKHLYLSFDYIDKDGFKYTVTKSNYSYHFTNNIWKREQYIIDKAINEGIVVERIHWYMVIYWTIFPFIIILNLAAGNEDWSGVTILGNENVWRFHKRNFMSLKNFVKRFLNQ